jgi:hypothetical protein
MELKLEVVWRGEEGGRWRGRGGIGKESNRKSRGSGFGPRLGGQRGFRGGDWLGEELTATSTSTFPS